MILNIFCLICAGLFFFALGVFAIFVIFKLRKIDSQLDNIPKHHWSMSVYMNDIPQTEQNTLHLSSVPLRQYERGIHFNFPVPHIGEEIYGIYRSGKNRFEMTGTVENACYNTNMDWIAVECKCTDIRKL